MKSVASLALLGALIPLCFAFAAQPIRAQQVDGNVANPENDSVLFDPPEVKRTLGLSLSQWVVTEFENDTGTVHYMVEVPMGLSVSKGELHGFDWHSVLKLDSVRAEIGRLTPTQNFQVAQILKLGDQLIVDIWREENRKSKLERIGELASKLADVLKQDQLRRLKQLALRYQLHQRGFESVILHGSKFKSLSISSKQTEWMGLKSKNLPETFFDTQKMVQLDWYKRLLSPLSNEQKEELVQSFGADYIAAYRKNRTLPALHFLNIPMNSKRKSKDEFGYAQLFTANVFEVSGAGQYEPRHYRTGVRTRDLSELAFRELLGMLGREGARADLELTPKQNAQIAQLAAAKQPSDETFAFKGDYLLLSLEQLDEQKATRDLFAKAKREIETFLTPEQIVKLKMRCVLSGMKNRGIAASLIDGYLNRQLAVADDQRDTIKAVARKIRGEICEYDARIREAYYDAMIECLDERQQKQIREKMGEPLPGGWLQQSAATR